MAKSNKFGTFGGVFVPSILTILGVIMYLRLPMIVGEAGLWYTLGIIAVAHLISVTTGLSVSSIATDKKVQAGGTYYMISRSLGLPIGGTLGLALFVGLSFSVSLYLIGFSESFLNYWGFDTNVNSIRITGTIVLLAVTILTFISTSLAIKTQYFIMTAIVLSLISIFFGNHDYSPSETLLTQTPSAVPLMVLFGIFFPAVTGFEAGVSMSGDLKDPKKSIPVGSILAILVGLIVYILLALFFSSTVSSEVLRNDPSVLLNISWIPELVIAGIWGATLSSALGSILGAPRILQATAKDRITPKFFAKGYSASNEPRNALLLTFFIAEAGILIGELDVIARVVSIFFITTYGFLNISAAFERWTSTDFRPEFKVSGWISLLGAIACLIVMIQLDFIAMLGATAIMVLLFLFLKRRELTLDSGDAWSGVWASMVKAGLTYLKREKLHERNWRPNTIMFAGNPENRKHMVEIGIAISGKLGVLSGFELIQSDADVFRREKSVLKNEKDSLEYFHHKIYCANVFDGMDNVARMYGFSGVEPNTILMGWSRNPSNKEQFINTLQSFRKYAYNTIFLDYDHEKKFGNHSSIDIWWGGSSRNLSLAISLIRNLTNSQLWKSSYVRLLLVNAVNEDYEDIYRSISSILMNYREDIEVKIINNEIDPIPVKEIIAAESNNTDLVILEIPNPKFNQLAKYYDEISNILESIGSALVINASDDFEELEVASYKAKGEASLREYDDQLDLNKVPLNLSKYPEVASDILKIDRNGQKVLELFHKKTLAPVIKDHLYILSELSKRVALVLKDLNKMKNLPDLYRRRKTIDKIKNDVLFQINSLFESELNDDIIPDQMDKITEGISWYQQRLREDYYKYPHKLKINYEKVDFKSNKNDRLSFKIFKTSKTLKHRVIGFPITHSVRYREVACYYQLNNRFVFLKHFFKRFQEEDIAFYYYLRKVTKAITNHLDEIEHKLDLDPSNWGYETSFLELEKLIEEEKSKQINLLRYYSGRLQLEFRKNLQLMNNDLSKLDINSLIRKKSRSNKYYIKIATEITEFPNEHILKIKTLLNMILMELSVNAAKNRLEIFHEEFIENLVHLIHQKFNKILAAVQDLHKLNDPSNNLKKVKIDEDFEAELKEGFDETLERMIALTESLPETLEIYSLKNNYNQDEETLSIPVARMAEYYLRSKYELPVKEKFKELISLLKKSLYNLKDLLVLAQFNLDNLSNSDDNKVQQDILADVLSKIKNENENIDGHGVQFQEFANKQFEEVFEPLSTTRIEESASEYIFGLRNYQGKKVLSGVNRISYIVGSSVKSAITKLFYSRSEGILLAKRLNKSKDLQSSISRILDLKEKVCPSVDVMNALPPFYVTLFNGKSSVGKDFWISRPEEEKVFSRAIKRYQEGFSGGILILGERNSGKTSFCKYESQKYLRSHRIFSIFSPIQGAITTGGFIHALKIATQIEGDVDQIMKRLEAGTVLIINDFELFWERSAEGLEIVNLVERLIDTYGQNILFIINLNPHAYKLINRMTSFSSHFIDIINFTPFNAEEIKDLIMKRHKSTGLNLKIESSKIPLNELQMAQMFNAYFNYSLGNPGTALNGWLSNIHKVSIRELYISKPKNPSLSILKDLNQDWTMVLVQFILHKRLTSEKLVRISGWPDSKVQEILLAMHRSGIVVEKAYGIHHIDPYLQPFITTALKEKEILS